MADTSPFTQIAKGHPDWKQIQKQVRAEGHEKAAKRFEPTLANPDIPRDQKVRQLARQFKDMDQAMGELFASKVRDQLHAQFPEEGENLIKAWLNRKKPDSLEIAAPTKGPQLSEFSQEHAQDAVDLYKTPPYPVHGTQRDQALNQFYQGALRRLRLNRPIPLQPWPTCTSFCDEVSEYTPQAKAAMLAQIIEASQETP